MKIDDLSLEKLKDLARSKKGHPALKGFTKMKKEELASKIKKHFKSSGGALVDRANPLEKGDKYKVRSDLEQARPYAPQAVGGGRCWEGYKPVPGKMPFSKGSCRKAIGGSLKTHIQKLRDHVGKLKGMIEKEKAKRAKAKGGQLSESIKDKANNLAIGGSVKDEEIDWDDIKWGKFSDQLNRYNSTSGKKLDLCQFADMILSADKSKYSATTRRRANFYRNVLAKKKC